MSNNKSQISPIPPEDYGDRFVKFIVGLTKTREEAEREARSTDLQMDGSIHTDRQPSFALSRHSTDKVIQKAEKQAQKSEKQGASEENLRDRTLTTDRTTGGGATLPVVEEDGEKDETGSRENSIRHDHERSEDAHHFSSSEETTNPMSSGETQIHHPIEQQPRKGHRHLPSLPFFNRLSMSDSSGVHSGSTER